MMVATDFVKMFLGLAGWFMLAAAARILAGFVSIDSLPDHRRMDVPQLESCSLDDIEEGSNTNDNDDTIPKVPCKGITRNLQIAVIKNLS